jgi:hypothetical protein
VSPAAWPVPAAGPEQAREALRTALDAWQNGQTVSALQGQSPSITIADGDYLRGCRLVCYQLADNDRLVGLRLHCTVTLSLQDDRGRSFEKKVFYKVDTDP